MKSEFALIISFKSQYHPNDEFETTQKKGIMYEKVMSEKWLYANLWFAFSVTLLLWKLELQCEPKKEDYSIDLKKRLDGTVPVFKMLSRSVR